MNILAIDPGNTESAFCLLDGYTLIPKEKGKVENQVLRADIAHNAKIIDIVVIERVASYGMGVGREVFETCEWVGRYTEVALKSGIQKVEYIYRMEEKKHICHDSRAKDTNIRRALIDRFAEFDLNNGKGTKKNPDYFYGFSKDVWAAYAVGLTYAETKIKAGG